jgi:membrane associated rhomboid family serine protease
MFSFLNNIPSVTKNILILNILFYVATLVLGSKGIHLTHILGAHYVNSPLFEPYQVVTHFFMHSPQIFHVLFNMFALVMFGSNLERIWGAQRFFVFYIATAMGAFALYNFVGVYQIIELKNQLVAMGYEMTTLNNALIEERFSDIILFQPHSEELINEYAMKIITPMVGASGAVFGVLAAFAYLFPNTELMLLFPPIPIKAKYLISALLVFELYFSFNDRAGDNVAHLAHVGGAVVGFILVVIWNKNRKTFY